MSTRPGAASLDDPFEALNDDFRSAYAARRTSDAHAVPVLVLLAESLVLFRGDERVERAVCPKEVRALKAAAHFPVGVFVALEASRARRNGDAFDSIVLEQLRAIKDVASGAARLVDDLDEPLRSDTQIVFDRGRSFLDSALAKARATKEETSMFAAEMGPLLLRLTEHATRLQLASLHAEVEALLVDLSSTDREGLEVVVAGAHQARVRSLGLQYFQKRFGEASGEEKRVTYAEAATDAGEARALVGTRIVDRSIARAFFGDEKKLQRDVLGDVAKALLDETMLTRIA